MTTRRWRLALIGVAVLLVMAAAIAAAQLPAIGAGGLLHPFRRRLNAERPAGCADVTFAGQGVSLKGWRCAASSAPRGTIVYLHGIADNRASAGGVIARFGKRGFDVIAYDARAHGESTPP